MLLKNLKDAIQGKARLGKRRSSGWAKVRATHLWFEPLCQVCGGKDKLEVHHKISFHENPDLELDIHNLITLCESSKGGIVCHLAVGHLGNYRKTNPTVTEDAVWWSKKLGKKT